MRASFVALLVLCAWVAYSGRAPAWNASGHMQIALFAYEDLPDSAQRSLVQLLKMHPRYGDDFAPQLPKDLSPAEQDRWIFAFASTWPDVVRGNPEYDHPTWHYVNLPLRQRRGQISTCREARAEWEASVAPTAASATPDSIVHAVARAERVLGDESRPAPERAIALSWLLHLVADAHQPLHGVALFTERRFASGDRGGNDIILLGRGSLHRVWDDLLGDRTDLPALDAALRALRARSARAAAERAGNELSVGRWIDESCALARSSVYVPAVLAAVQRFEVEHAGSAAKPEVSLKPAYIDTAALLARHRAAQAAGRLRALLLATVGSASGSE